MSITIAGKQLRIVCGSPHHNVVRLYCEEGGALTLIAELELKIVDDNVVICYSRIINNELQCSKTLEVL